MIRRIALVTDFGLGGPYLGQMHLVLDRAAPSLPVVELVSDLPPFRPDLAAYLLPQLARDVPKGTLYLCVVDPGVGGERGVVALEADGNWYVGPDNGLLAVVGRRATAARWWRVDWRPERLSVSFHGRDLFAPLGARIALGDHTPGTAVAAHEPVGADWPEDLWRVIYRDAYGNLSTGVRAQVVPRETRLLAAGRPLARARTFSSVAVGEAFWYKNSFGLVELAVNQGSAALALGLGPGDPVSLAGWGGAGPALGG
jgi:S-adenosyl-L-methionine hydrolase (adenosine-forming)